MSGSSATTYGGGFGNVGNAYLINVTLSGNSAALGGALRAETIARTILTNTIVAYSTSGGNCSGPVASSKYSIDSDGTCALGGTGDMQGDPLLTALGNFGGATLVHMPKTGSPAIDGVFGNDAPGKDQRGKNRPAPPRYDNGAVERQPNDSSLAPRLYLPNAAALARYPLTNLPPYSFVRVTSAI